MHIRRLILFSILVLVLAGCSRSSPLESLRSNLDQYPEYSIVLEDMHSQGLFFHDYFHRYRLIYFPQGKSTGQEDTPKPTQSLTDWIKVDRAAYDHYRPYLGMVLFSKKPDGSKTSVPEPPGYQYVGDSRFGEWKTDDQGNRFWAWLATSMVLSEVLDKLGDTHERGRRRIDYGEWQDYRRNTNNRTPYFGRKDDRGRPQFGTGGSVTQKSNRGFFERQQARMAERKSTFAQKVESRMGRKKVSGYSRMMGRRSGK